MAFEIYPLEVMRRSLEFDPSINNQAQLYTRAHTINYSPYFYMEIIKREMNLQHMVNMWYGGTGTGESLGALGMSVFRKSATIALLAGTEVVYEGKRYIYWFGNRAQMLRTMRKLEAKGSEVLKNTTMNLDERPKHYGLGADKEVEDYNNIVKMSRAYQICFNHISPKLDEELEHEFRIKSLREFDKDTMRAKHLFFMEVGNKFIPVGFIYTKMPPDSIRIQYTKDKMENIGKEIEGKSVDRITDLKEAAREMLNVIDFREANNDPLRRTYIEEKFGSTRFTTAQVERINKLAQKMLLKEMENIPKEEREKAMRTLRKKKSTRDNPNDPKNQRILALLRDNPNMTYEQVGLDPKVNLTAGAVSQRMSAMRKRVREKKDD